MKSPPAAVLRFLPLFYARLIGKVRIIAANVRTAAVYPRAGDFARISPAPLSAGYGRLCIVGGGFRLDAQQCFRLDAQQFHLLRRVKPASLANFKSLCYFALNLMRKSSLATEG